MRGAVRRLEPNMADGNGDYQGNWLLQGCDHPLNYWTISPHAFLQWTRRQCHQRSAPRGFTTGSLPACSHNKHRSRQMPNAKCLCCGYHRSRPLSPSPCHARCTYPQLPVRWPPELWHRPPTHTKQRTSLSQPSLHNVCHYFPCSSSDGLGLRSLRSTHRSFSPSPISQITLMTTVRTMPRRTSRWCSLVSCFLF